jgi:putative tricarboxylic transport membrane protein
MKIDDALWGAALLLLAALLGWYVQGFPSIPGQQVGPNALPRLLAVGFAVCGVMLVRRGLRQRTTATPWVYLPAWWAAMPQRRAFAVLIAVNLLYLLAAQRLGFVIVGVIYLFALMWSLRVRPRRALLIAAVGTLAIHFVFYKLLKVPLPWGVLQGVAW